MDRFQRLVRTSATLTRKPRESHLTGTPAPPLCVITRPKPVDFLHQRLSKISGEVPFRTFFLFTSPLSCTRWSLVGVEFGLGGQGQLRWDCLVPSSTRRCRTGLRATSGSDHGRGTPVPTRTPCSGDERDPGDRFFLYGLDRGGSFTSRRWGSRRPL